MDNEKKVVSIKERPFKVCDRVWDICLGAGVVIEELSMNPYPTKVEFGGATRAYMYFTSDGRIHENCNRTLFHHDAAEQAGFVDMKIEIIDKPEFEPEKGKLYYRPESGEILEYITHETYLADCGMNVDYRPCHMANAIEMREFDGFSRNDIAWVNDNGKIYKWTITNFSIMGNMETISITDGCQELTIDYNGNALGLPLKFYRSRHRAERLGK